MERLREKSVALTGLLEQCLQRLHPQVRMITPGEPAARGCQLSIRIEGTHSRRIFERLGEQGVICDWREPDTIRVAPVPLYNQFADVMRFAEHLERALVELAS
jgi:kynureninase